MKILFDHGTPVPLRQQLTGHQVRTAFEMSWSTLTNGELLKAAEMEQFAMLITTDKNLRHQQNLARRKLAILVLPTTSWPKLRQHVDEIAGAIDSTDSGAIRELSF